MPKVLITREIPEVGPKMLEAAGFEVEVAPQDGVIDRKVLLEKVAGVDAILPMLTEKIDDELLDAAGDSLKIVANYAVGYNNIDVEALKKRGVVGTNTPGVLTDAVAEHAMALMLSIARRVVEADDFARAGKYEGWGPMLLLGRSLIGKKLGIVGLGRIGSRVAEIAHNGFGMDIHYYDVKENAEFNESVNATFHGDIDELLKLADYVTVHVPLLPATKHLINADRLKEMNSEAYLINTSRGPVVDEEALYKALKDGEIAGAAIDVFEKEPKYVKGMEDLPNIILTPHIASGTIETRSAMAELAARNIIAVLNGEDPETPVTN